MYKGLCNKKKWGTFMEFRQKTGGGVLVLSAVTANIGQVSKEIKTSCADTRGRRPLGGGQGGSSNWVISSQEALPLGDQIGNVRNRFRREGNR